MQIPPSLAITTDGGGGCVWMHQLDKAAKSLSPCFGECFSQIGPSALPAPVPAVHIRPSQTAGWWMHQLLQAAERGHHPCWAADSVVSWFKAHLHFR